MKRPDTTSPADFRASEQDRVGEPTSGPSDALIEGTRRAMDPPGDARHDLIEAAVSRLEPRKRKLERPPARWEAAIAGLLVGLATFAFLLGRMTVADTAPLLLRVLASVVCGGAVAAYLWYRDRARSQLRSPN